MKETQVTIPHLFTCPISLDLFADPVTLCTGQTYDRSSIEKWLAAGNLTCPVTMQKLRDLSLVPNHTLRHLIDQWRQMGQPLGPLFMKPIDPLGALKLSLESPEASLEDKIQTLERIQALIQESPSRSFCLLQLGFLPLLFELLFKHLETGFSQVYLNFAEQALSCVLRLLPPGELGCLNVIRKGLEMEYFLFLFDHGSNLIKKNLCQLVDAISSCPETKELCAILGKNPKFLRGLVLLIRQNHETSDAGIKAISGLCSLGSNGENLVQEGAIDGLISYILNNGRPERSLVPTAMARLEQLLGLKSGQDALLSNPNGVKALVKMVFRVSDHQGSESAINSLTIICNGSFEACEKAVAAGVLTQLLLLLQSQCNGKAKTKARMLLKLLRSKWGP